MKPAPMPVHRLFVLSLLALVLAAGPFLMVARPARAGHMFVVTSVGDQLDPSPADRCCDIGAAPGAQCTLRAAIQTANATPGADTIAFDIPGALTAVKVIRPNDPATPGGPNGQLPDITGRVTIDGYTQPGAGPNTAAVGTNAKIRIELDGTFTFNADGVRIQATAANTLIRGLAIGRFGSDGIEIGADDVRVVGCFVGTNAAGTNPRPNGSDGIEVDGADIVIGNSPLSARNLTSGNAGDGVVLFSSGTGARVLGNLIGTNRTGTAPLANGGDGILSRATDTRIGGNSLAEANVVRFNGGDGVTVTLGTRTRILRNAIGANGDLGIDLNDDGHTNNDAKDPDPGPNNRQNFPVITVATPNLVQITLNSVPNQNFFIRIYSNPGPGGDEGIRFHGGPFAVNTDPVTGDTGPENLTPNPPIPAGRSVTVTAIRGNSDTSEFSDPELVVA